MPSSKLRNQIAWQAALLLQASPELTVAAARDLALQQFAGKSPRRYDLPTDDEIVTQLRSFAPAERKDSELGIADRIDRYRRLLLPLEDVRQNPLYHPEGDALYHSLQVFDHARDHAPYDAEFLAAALLHDVGKAIDPRNHVAAGLAALSGSIESRTTWLIEHHMLCHDLHEGRLGSRRRKQLEASEWFEDLVLFGQCDRAGREVGVEVPDVEESLDYLSPLLDG